MNPSLLCLLGTSGQEGLRRGYLLLVLWTAPLLHFVNQSVRVISRASVRWLASLISSLLVIFVLVLVLDSVESDSQVLGAVTNMIKLLEHELDLLGQLSSRRS